LEPPVDAGFAGLLEAFGEEFCPGKNAAAPAINSSHKNPDRMYALDTGLNSLL
jgi:hypothetical protein